MHKKDIERLRAQIRRVADQAAEIIEDAHTVGDAGFDPSQSKNILQQQQALTEELAQALADFNELTSRAERVESDTIRYEPTSDSLNVSYDSANNQVTVAYTGSATVPQSDITVLRAGSEITPFGGDVTSGASVTIDVSSLSDGDSVTVKMSQQRVQTGYKIRPWEDILGSSNATAPQINIESVKLPDHNLTPETRTLTRNVTIGKTA